MTDRPKTDLLRHYARREPRTFDQYDGHDLWDVEGELHVLAVRLDEACSSHSLPQHLSQDLETAFRAAQ